MYPAGWKHTGIYNSGSVSTAINHFARGLEADQNFQICCEGAKYVMFSNAAYNTGSDTAALAGTTKFKIYGTQTNGESTQNIDWCFNTLLAEPQLANSSSITDIPDLEIPGLEGLKKMKTWNGGTANFTNSGVQDDTSSANEISCMHFFNRVAGNQTIAGFIDTDESARSADAPSGDKYWVFTSKDGSGNSAGPTWICIPAGPFNFMQLQMSTVNSANSTSILYNVLY